MLVANTVVIGSKIGVVGRVSHQLLDCLKIELGQVIRSGAIGNRSFEPCSSASELRCELELCARECGASHFKF